MVKNEVIGVAQIQTLDRRAVANQERRNLALGFPSATAIAGSLLVVVLQHIDDDGVGWKQLADVGKRALRGGLLISKRLTVFR